MLAKHVTVTVPTSRYSRKLLMVIIVAKYDIYQERKANMKRDLLRRDYRNKVIKLHNFIERLVTNRPLSKVSPLKKQRKRKNGCFLHVTCGSCKL